MLNNPDFKGGEFDPLLREAGTNAFTIQQKNGAQKTLI